MSFTPRRDAGNPFISRRPYGIMDTENYIHETIMYLVSILEGEESASMELTKLTVELCKRGNTKPLKKVASGDSVEERVLAFAWQHPSIFQTNDRIISLRSMKPDIDDELECNLEERLIQFLVFRCNQYGPCQIPISKLMGNLHQAASDIRFHFHNDYSRFHNFLRTRSDIFTLIDSETVALKTVLDQAILTNKSLLKCDEYFLDERVLNCTKMVDTFSEGIQIVREILNTKEIVAIDCEGVNLGAPTGYITLVQLAIVEKLPENHTDDDIVKAMKIYLFDVQQDSDLMYIALKKLLKSSKITKIFQGCSSDATALYNRYKIVTDSVFDTVIAHRHLNEGAKSDLYYLYEYYVGEGTNRMKKDIKKKYISNPRLWTNRPLTELLTYYAAFDVFALIRIYYKLRNQIDDKTYQEIWEKSTATAQAAYRRALPLYGLQLYGKGHTLAQVHAEIGWELDSDDEISLGLKKQSNRNDKPRSRQFAVNGKPNYHQTSKHPRNYKHNETGNGSSGSTSNYHQRNAPNYDNNNSNNYSKYYNGHALYHSSYVQHRLNHRGECERVYRLPHEVTNTNTRLPQDPSYPIQQRPNHYNNTQQQQRNYYHNYQPPQFKYQQPYQYQANFQYQSQYQPNHHYQQQQQQQQQQQYQLPTQQQHHHYQQNQYQQQPYGNQQESTQTQHQNQPKKHFQQSRHFNNSRRNNQN